MIVTGHGLLQVDDRHRAWAVSADQRSACAAAAVTADPRSAGLLLLLAVDDVDELRKAWPVAVRWRAVNGFVRALETGDTGGRGMSS